MRSHIRMLALVSSLLLAIGACGTGDGADPTAFPTGEWTTTCERGVIRVMDFRPDGTFTLHNGSSIESLSPTTQGTYTTSGEEITIVATEYCPDPGEYAWSLEGEKLFFSLVEDDCWPRSATFEGGLVWTRVES